MYISPAAASASLIPPTTIRAEFPWIRKPNPSWGQLAWRIFSESSDCQRQCANVMMNFMCGMPLNERLCNCNGLRLDLTSLTLLIYNLTPPPLPSCRHIPKAKATAIADTPELKRIAENTKIQSNVKYHADFEKAKGKFTQVSAERVKISSKNLYFWWKFIA